MTTRSEKITDVAEKVLGIIEDLPDASIERLLSAWNTGTKITKYNLEQITGISGQKISPLRYLVMDPSINQELIMAMFVTGLNTKLKMLKNTNKIEIIWTGPSTISAGIRNTRPVIEEMLRSANPGEKVTIIDYRITSQAESIVDELNLCLKTGVNVDLIVDKNNANERELKKCFAEKNLVRPIIYTRKGKQPEFYKVHAKVIVIADRQMLVSSANLTGLGTEVNFEIGLLVSGPIVKNMIKLIKKMIDDEYFIGDTYHD